MYTSATLLKYPIFAEITDDVLKFDGFLFRRSGEYKNTTYWSCFMRYTGAQCRCLIKTEIINGYEMIKTKRGLKGLHTHGAPHLFETFHFESNIQN